MGLLILIVSSSYESEDSLNPSLNTITNGFQPLLMFAQDYLVNIIWTVLYFSALINLIVTISTVTHFLWNATSSHSQHGDLKTLFALRAKMHILVYLKSKVVSHRGKIKCERIKHKAHNEFCLKIKKK